MITTFAADNPSELEAAVSAAGHAPGDVSLWSEYCDTSAAREDAPWHADGPQQLVITADGLAPHRFTATVADESVVFLPSILPVDANGAVIAPGDLVAQTEAAFAEAGRLLGEQGLSLDDVVMTVDYLTFDGLKQYKGTGAVRNAALSAPYPGSAGIIMDRLAHPEALMGLDVIASREPLEGINPGWERYGKLTYLPAVKAGDTLFMSGQAALDPVTETALHADDVVEQARYTYGNIVAVLGAAGLGPDALVSSIEYFTPAGLDRRSEVAAVRREVLGGHEPMIVELACAGLLRREFQLEVIPLAVF